MSGFTVGCDLGQAQDFTAISVIERAQGALPEGYREDQNGLVYKSDHYAGKYPVTDPRTAAYHVRFLERPPLGTKYPTVIERVKGLLATEPLNDDTPLVVDRTGVGVAVVDMFTAAGMRPISITITGGNEINRDDPYDLRVPKRELVGCLVMLFQTGRLKVADGLPEGQTLVSELLNFKMKVNIATGHDTYEAWRESVHDDLVLSVALACWHAENFPPGWNQVQYAPNFIWEHFLNNP